MTPLSDAERRRIRSQISCSLCNLRAFKLYWLPRLRVIVCRSVSVRRRFRVPEGACLVGTYSHGIAAADILSDLAELLEGRRDAAEEPHPLAPAPEPEAPKLEPACEAAPEPMPEPEPEPLPPITSLEWLHRIAPAYHAPEYPFERRPQPVAPPKKSPKSHFMRRLRELLDLREPEPRPPLTALEWLNRIAPSPGCTPYATNYYRKRRRDALLPGRKPKAKAETPPPACEAGDGEAIALACGPTPSPETPRAPAGS